MYLPAGQSVQASSPKAAKVPMGHLVQELPVVEGTCPAGQGSQEELPGLVVKVPEGQGVQAPSPGVAVILPTGHSMQEEAPASEYFPAGH